MLSRTQGRPRHSFDLLSLLLVVALLFSSQPAVAFQPPTLGIGAVLFPVRGLTTEPISAADTRADQRQALQEASDFFVDAFWTAKVGGGATKLSSTQKSRLQQSQLAEFTKRYGGSRRVAELLVARNTQGEIVACAGVEVDRIPDGRLQGPITATAPLMSNLAVSRKYRRRGLAEALVKAIESYALNEWEFDECYLYVERRNVGAVQLYQKMGYRRLWQDDSATTLMPTNDGNLLTSPTSLVCMRKNLQPSLFDRLFG